MFKHQPVTCKILLNWEICKKNESVTVYLSLTSKIVREYISSVFFPISSPLPFIFLLPFYEQKSCHTNIFLARLLHSKLPFDFWMLFLIQNKYDRMNRTLLLWKGRRQCREAETQGILNMQKKMIVESFKEKKADIIYTTVPNCSWYLKVK